MSKPMTRSERWGAGVALVVILGLFGLEIALNYQPAKLSALVMLLAWLPLLALHEGGHAVMARVLGQRVDAVVIGFGKTMWIGTIRGTTVEVRLFPIEGFTRTGFSRSRLASALVYFAGPGAELLLATLLMLIVSPAEMFSRSDSIGVVVCQGIALAAVMSAVLNLWPAEVRREDHPDAERIANDGLGIWRSLFGG